MHDVLATTRHEFSFSDSAAFRWHDGEKGSLELQLVGPARYQPPHRSPLAIALVPTPVVEDFDLRLRARQTSREYAHRDLCLIFGFRDPAHFAYVHLASAADANAHGVFLVDGAPRRKLTGGDHAGIVWGSTESWHDIRLTRTAGRLLVWFDSDTAPVFDADVAAVGPGAIGFGSFDDSGVFTKVRLEAALRPDVVATPFANANDRMPRPR